MGHTLRCEPHLEIWLTLVKVGTLRKVDHTLKSGSRLKKSVTFRKMGHTSKNGSFVKIWVTLEKKDHT